MWPGQGISFKVNEVVHTDRSDFQVRAMCGVRCAMYGVQCAAACGAHGGHGLDMQRRRGSCSRGFAWICVGSRDSGMEDAGGVFVDTR